MKKKPWKTSRHQQNHCRPEDKHFRHQIKNKQLSEHCDPAGSASGVQMTPHVCESARRLEVTQNPPRLQQAHLMSGRKLLERQAAAWNH